jgi:hypothetical protein
MSDFPNTVNDDNTDDDSTRSSSKQESIESILRMAEQTSVDWATFSVSVGGMNVTLTRDVNGRPQSDPDGHKSTNPKGLLSRVERSTKGLELAAAAAAGVLGVIVTAVELRRSGRRQQG